MSQVRIAIFNRALAVAGLAGIAATLLAPQDASAFGHGLGGGFGARGGGQRASFDGRGFGHLRDPGFHRVPRFPGRDFDHRPGRFPPIRIVLPPHHRHPPIFIPPWHRGPHLPPPIIVRAPVPVVVGGPVAIPAVRQLQADAPAPVASCIREGTLVSVVFVPTVTAADITTFLKTYNVTMADGPNPDGIYRIRLSADAMPQNEVLQIVESMRAQTAIVSSVDGA